MQRRPCQFACQIKSATLTKYSTTAHLNFQLNLFNQIPMMVNKEKPNQAVNNTVEGIKHT